MKPQRHTWKGCRERRIAACDSPDGNDRTERVCAACGVMRITVHGAHGRPWVEWRSADGINLAARPGCIAVADHRQQEQKAA